jgi:exodeoxyribonuclease VII small subunit
MPQKTPKPNLNFNFARSMAELEAITQSLESSTLDLDQAIAKFERGAELARLLEDYLNKAEVRIKHIKQKFDSNSG